MFKINVGPLDRSLRIILGLVLIAGFFIWPDVSFHWAFLIGIVGVVTGLMKTCPIYSVLGISTCRACPV